MDTQNAEFIAVWVFNDLGILQGRQPQISQCGLASIDDLMRRVFAAFGRVTDIACLYVKRMLAKSIGARAFQNDEHFIIRKMVVKGKRPFAGLNLNIHRADVFRAQSLANFGDCCAECVANFGTDVIGGQIVDMNDRRAHFYPITTAVPEADTINID